MSQRGELVFCPVCRRYMVYRKNQRCVFCHTELYFLDEFIPSSSEGFVYAKNNMWIKIEKWIKEVGTK